MGRGRHGRRWPCATPPHGRERRRRPPSEAAPCGRSQAGGDRLARLTPSRSSRALDLADGADWRRAYRARSSPSLAWPSITWITRISTFCSSRWVKRSCAARCAATRAWRYPPGSRQCAQRAQAGGRTSELTGFWPGKSHACGRAVRHQFAQQFEQSRREHHVPIPLSLALLDPQRHALAVNIGHLQGVATSDTRRPAP